MTLENEIRIAMWRYRKANGKRPVRVVLSHEAIDKLWLGYSLFSPFQRDLRTGAMSFEGVPCLRWRS